MILLNYIFRKCRGLYKSGEDNGWHPDVQLFAKNERKLETIILLNKKNRTLEARKIYKYERILETDAIKQAEMKQEFKREYFRRTRNLVENKLYCRNFIERIHIWAVPLWDIRDHSWSGQRKNIQYWIRNITWHSHITNTTTSFRIWLTQKYYFLSHTHRLEYIYMHYLLEFLDLQRRARYLWHEGYCSQL